MSRYVVLGVLFASQVYATARYYSAYLPLGNGDNYVQTTHENGGAQDAIHKWNIECLDGEAAVGIRLPSLFTYRSGHKHAEDFCYRDLTDNYQRIDTVWCKYMFAYKSATQGTYPYESPRDARLSVGTYMTATDIVYYYKCCKTPKGYYIDYVSCYYVATHDQYGEYYDSMTENIVVCGTGYVVTGMMRKTASSIPYDFNLDWIQCCRVGYGSPAAVSPPVTYNNKRIPTFHASSIAGLPLLDLTAAGNHLAREERLGSSIDSDANFSEVLSPRSIEVSGMRYREGPVPAELSFRNPIMHHYDDPRSVIMRAGVG